MTDTAPRRRPGPRRTLSDQHVLDAAQNLLTSRGADAVTIRGIATVIGVAPNAVYTYFPDKAAVLGALAERLLGEATLAELADGARPWRARLHSQAAQLRTQLLSRPGAVNLLLACPLTGPSASLLASVLGAVFEEAGVASADADRASRLFIASVLGAVALEAADLALASPEHEQPAADRFAWGLDRLLDGLAVDETRPP